MPMHYGKLGKWLGRLDSNQGMAVPKTAALPLGYAPTRADRRGGEEGSVAGRCPLAKAAWRGNGFVTKKADPLPAVFADQRFSSRSSEFFIGRDARAP